jgi:DNA repair protein RecO (recombination protein O)
MRLGKIYTVTALILKRTNVGETDRLLTIFSKTHGKKRVLAKGVRTITSRRGPHLDALSEVKLTLHQGKTWDTVTEADTIFSGRLVYTSWMRMRAAYMTADILDHVVASDDPHPVVYDLASKTFQTIGHGDEQRLEENMLYFCNKILFLLGFLTEEKFFLRLSDAIAHIERMSERKIRTAKFFSNLLQ